MSCRFVRSDAIDGAFIRVGEVAMWSGATGSAAMVVAIIALAACGTQTAGADAAGADVKQLKDGVVDGKGDIARGKDAAQELPADTTPPTVKIVNPKDGAFVSGVETIEVEAEDDREMDRVELYVDGGLLATLTSEPYQHEWDVTGLIPGNYEITAVAYDNAGHSAQDTVVVFVQAECDENGDCPPKSVKIITPVDGSTVCGDVTIEATATADNGIAEMEFFVDGDSLGVAVESPFSKKWDTTDYDNGEHTVKVVVTDALGYEAFASIKVLVKNDGEKCDNDPSVFILEPQDEAYVYGIVDVKADASDDKGVVKVQFLIDNAMIFEDDTAKYKAEWDTGDYEEQAHTVKGIAYDTANQEAEMQIQVTVDRTPPEIALLSPSTGIPYHDLVTFEAEATDNFKVDRVEFTIDGDDPVVISQAPYSMDLDAADWASGSYDFEAVAFDGAEHADSVVGEFLLDRPPLLSISAPGDDSTVYGTVDIEAQADDDLGLQEVALYIDGEWKAAMQSQGGGSYQYGWKTPYLKTDHEVKVVATDLAGQEAEAEIQVTVDHPVEVDLLLCDEQDCLPLEEDTELTGVVNFLAEAKDDGSEIAGVEFHVDGNLEGVDESGPFEFEWDSSLVADGAHVLEVIAANDLAETGKDMVEVIVNNCDLDSDGYLAATCGGTDCDDLDIAKNPGEADVVGNAADENCDGVDGIDTDGDGYASEESGGIDCDDGESSVHPCADDLANDGADSNCDGDDLLSCDDCSLCTKDAFNLGGCEHEPIQEGEVCEDGNLCTEGETCSEGQCTGGEPVECDDDDPCSLDLCHPQAGCAYPLDPGLDGESCEGGLCYLGQCCTPSCIDKECGTDGCGGTCGDCPGFSEICAEGICLACDQEGKNACLSAAEVVQCQFGEWKILAVCPDSYFCFAGACVELVSCEPGENDGCLSLNALSQCNTQGNAYVPVDCPADQNCAAGVCGIFECLPGQSICLDSDTKQECLPDGSDWGAGEICEVGEVCVGGQCLSYCQSAPEWLNSYVGCEYWTLDLDNYHDPFSPVPPDEAVHGVIVGNPGTQTATVTFTSYASEVDFPLTMVTVGAGQSKVVELPRMDIDGAIISDRSVRIQSNRPVFVQQHNPLEFSSSLSTDSSLLLPAEVLGTEYLILSYPTSPLEAFPFNPTMPSQHGYFTVLAVEAGVTNVTVKVAARTDSPAGDGTLLDPGSVHQFALEKGEVLNFQADGSQMFPFGELDVSGSHIVADGKIAVFAGHEEAVVGAPGLDCCCAEHLEEQLLPLASWDTTYVCAKAKPRGVVDADLWRVQAGADAVVLSTHPPVDGLDGVVLANKGDWVETFAEESFMVEATGPVQVAQYLSSQTCTDDFVGDPALIMGIPSTRFRKAYNLAVRPGFENNYATVVKPAGSTVQFAGGVLLQGGFTPVGDGSFEVGYFAVGEGLHGAVGSSPFGLYQYGFSGPAAYGHPGGFDLVQED